MDTRYGSDESSMMQDDEKMQKMMGDGLEHDE